MTLESTIAVLTILGTFFLFCFWSFGLGYQRGFFEGRLKVLKQWSRSLEEELKLVREIKETKKIKKCVCQDCKTIHFYKGD